jgi:hypothetical protein
MYFLGLVAGAGLAIFIVWLTRRKIVLKWYEWLIGTLATISLFATVQHYFASVRENEPKAAWMGALMFGLIFLVLAGLDWQLVSRRQKSSNS